MARARSREEKLFGAAVLRRSLELRGEEHKAALQPVYDGVLRDLGLTDDEVSAYLGQHGVRVDAAIGRGKA
ncbi:MAG: hypothetical protein HZB56_11705 [Deltaproteobacteria bacterium]|nr:hypothetical protein [Deltaproteobacteria bacterium]